MAEYQCQEEEYEEELNSGWDDEDLAQKAWEDEARVATEFVMAPLAKGQKFHLEDDLWTKRSSGKAERAMRGEAGPHDEKLAEI